MRLKLVSAVVLGLLVTLSTAQAMPAAPLQALGGAETVSFWAQPYPYGYRWRKTPCIRAVPTCINAAGSACEVRWQRVYVCR